MVHALAILALMFPLAAVAPTVPARGAPLPWGTKFRSTHVPYRSGDCAACHERKGPYPGPPARGGDALCFSCHDQLKQHAHAFRHCTRCHNAHDSVREHLLTADLDRCKDCHRG